VPKNSRTFSRGNSVIMSDTELTGRESLDYSLERDRYLLLGITLSMIITKSLQTSISLASPNPNKNISAQQTERSTHDDGSNGIASQQ